MNYNLERFEIAHQQYFQKALNEIQRAKKTSHWMWFIFPQLKGLGLSERSKFYGLGNIAEAQAFLDHPVLGKNLITISSALLQLATQNATAVMGQPDLVYYGYFGRTTYKFNKKFSFSALTAQTQRQLKSVGTFIPSLSYNYYIIDNDEILTGQNGSLKSKNLELLLSAGYYQTFIMHDHFYFSMGLVPGVGLITTKAMKELSSETVTDRYVNVIYRLEASSAFGYNAERLFFGAQLTAAASGYDQYITSNVIISNQLYYQVFAGYRFSAPDFLKNLLDKIESKTGRVLGRRGRH